MEQINVFTKGVVSDVDNSFVTAEQMVFPTENIRFFNRDGRGFVAVPMKGNELLFHVSFDFTPIAITYINGFFFIVSVNSNGYTEIGSFPWDPTDPNKRVDSQDLIGAGVYRPLSNFTNGVFRSTRFNYNIHSQVKLIADMAFDGSANLYLCDNENPDYAINCGFNLKSGMHNNITYNESNFNNTILHIPATLDPPTVELDNVIEGGELEPGNYQLFFRYSTSTFDKTEFITTIFPIVVGSGYDAVTTKGVMNNNDKGEQILSSKSIRLNVNTFDDAYDFISIGVIRFYSGADGNIVYDVYEISNRYTIENSTILITGNESKITLTLEELYTRYTKDRISKDHIILNKRIWKANLKRKWYNRKSMMDFARAIEVSIEIEEFDNTGHDYEDIENGDYTLFEYQSVKKIYSKLSYFETEIYPFAVLFLLSDGSLSDAFPLSNYDFMRSTPLVKGEPKGLIRMPRTTHTTPANRHDTDNFRMTPAFDYQKAFDDVYSTDPLFMENVVGFFILRGERIVNFLYDGYMVPTSLGFNHANNNIPEQYIIGETYNEAYSVITPMRGYRCDVLDTSDDEINNCGPSMRDDKFQYNVPFVVRSKFDDGNEVYYKYQYRNAYRLFNNRKYAFISADYIFSRKSNIQDGSSMYMEFDNTIITSDTPFVDPNLDIVTVPDDDENYKPSLKEYVHDVTSHLASSLPGKANAILYNVDQGVHKGPSKYSSFVSDFTEPYGSVDTPGDTPPNEDYFGLRSYKSTKFIGVDLPLPLEEIINYNKQIRGGDYVRAKIYKQEPTMLYYMNILSSFNFALHPYSMITGIIKLRGTKAALRVVPWKGDNFKQKIFIRIVRYFGFDDNPHEDHRDRLNFEYQYGLLFGGYYNTATNAAFRSFLTVSSAEDQSMTYTFYPANRRIIMRPEEWIFDSDSAKDDFESFAMNEGYDKTLGILKHIGVDLALPDIQHHYPTKINFSSKNIPGAFINNYRDIPIGNTRLYSSKYGEIMRLAEGFELLISIREHAAVRHYLGQKKLASQGGDIVTGNPDIYLAEDESILGYHGIQYFHAMVASKRMLYGYDNYSGVLWGIVFSSTQMGVKVADQIDISRKTFFEGKVRELKHMLNNAKDDVFNGYGVTLAYDDNFKEVTVTFLNGNAKGNVTFNEDLQVSGGSSKNLIGLSANGDGLFLTTMPMKNNGVYLNNVADGSTFYGKDELSLLSFIIIGNSGNKDNNATVIMKVFEALDIRSSYHKFEYIDFITEDQTVRYNFTEDDPKFWLNSEYIDGKWLVPIDGVSEDDMGINQVIRGPWLKVTLAFKQPDDMYIRSVITKFSLSLS